MNFTRILKRLLCASLLFAGSALADAVDVDALASGGTWSRDNQMREIGDVLEVGRGGYFDIGFYYFPIPTQAPLKSQFGEHEGFVFNHHASVFAASRLNTDNYLGALLWFERSGWDSEDFFFFPKYSDFGLARSVTTWGLVWTNTSMDVTIAAGMQHQNSEYVGDVYPAEDDSLAYTWANIRWGKVALQGSLYKGEYRHLRLSLNLESKSVLSKSGVSRGWSTYLPNLDATLYNREIDGEDEDFVRVNWEQNLFRQRLYGEVSFDFPDDGFHSASVKYYPDPSRLVGIEVNCLRRRGAEDHGFDDLLWGWAIELPVLRVGYNSAFDYEHLFHVKGTWTVEFQFNMHSLDNLLFGRGGAESAPIETNTINAKNRKLEPAAAAPASTNGGVKTLEATGVRYQAAPANGGK